MGTRTSAGTCRAFAHRRRVMGTAAAAVLMASMLSGCLHTERVSVASDGTEANGPSIMSSISRDGRYVTFGSTATNLVPNDTNGAVSDLYLRDNATGVVEKAAIEADGTTLDTNSSGGQISDDGRYVTFNTLEQATPDDTDQFLDAFRHDRQTGETRLVSKPPPGIADRNWGGEPSANGRFVVVHENVGATFVHDIDADVSWMVTTASVYPAEVSNDGQIVVFISPDKLVPEETATQFDVYTYDHTTETIELIVPGMFPPGEPQRWIRSLIFNLDISPDARYIAYSGFRNGGVVEAYVHDRVTNTTEAMPGLTPPATYFASLEGAPAISDDGRYVAYDRALYAELERPPAELVVYDRTHHSTTVIERLPNNLPISVLLSGDGLWAGFSAATDEVAADTNGVSDVFLRYAHDPQVSTPTPPQIGPGTTEVTLDATEIIGTPAVSVSGNGVTIDTVTVDDDQLRLSVTVSAGASPGLRDVFISNSGSWPGRAVIGATGICASCLTITP